MSIIKNDRSTAEELTGVQDPIMKIPISTLVFLLFLVVILGFIAGKIYKTWDTNNMVCFSKDEMIDTCQKCFEQNKEVACQYANANNYANINTTIQIPQV